MVTYVDGDIGKYLQLSRDSVVGTFKDEFIMVLKHGVNSAKASENITDVAVFKDQASLDLAVAAVAASDGSSSVRDVVTPHTRLIMDGQDNKALSKICGPGLWQPLFAASASRAVAGAGLGLGTPARVGKTFNAKLACIDAATTTITFVDGLWTVGVEVGSTGVFKLSATVGTVSWATTLPADQIDTLIGGGGGTPPPVETDVRVEGKDYPEVLKLVRMVHPSPDTTVSARYVLKLSSEAGQLVAAPAQAKDAPEGVLRRHATSALEFFECALAHVAMIGFSVSVSPATDIGLARALGKAKDAYVGVGTSTPVVPGGAPPPGAPTGPTGGAGGSAPSGPVTPAPASAHARFDVLKSKAASAAEFDSFCTDAMQIVEPDAAARAVILGHPQAVASTIDRFLVDAGANADPVVLGALAPGQSVGQLVALLATLRADIQAASVSPLAGASGATSGPIRLNVRSAPHVLDTTSSEAVMREKTRIQSDMVEVEKDPAAMGRLAKMQKLADAVGTDSDAGDNLAIEVAKEPDGALSRLLCYSVEVSQVSVEAEPHTVQSVTVVRGALDAALEKAVFGAAAAFTSDLRIRALRFIRQRRMAQGARRLLNLQDKKDSGTEEEPLKGFEDMKDDAAAYLEFQVAFSRFQAAWMFAAPEHGGEVLQYCQALIYMMQRGMKAGVSWKALGRYYKYSFRRVDLAVTGMHGCPSSPEPPKASWARGAEHEWVIELEREITVAMASAAARAVTPGNKRARKGGGGGCGDSDDDDVLEGDPAAHLTASQRKRQAKKAAAERRAAGSSGGGGKAAEAEKKRREQQAANDRKRAAEAKVDAERKSKEQKKSEAQKTQKEGAKALLDKMGMKDGKAPCWFHHEQGRCRFPAADCRFYH